MGLCVAYDNVHFDILTYNFIAKSSCLIAIFAYYHFWYDTCSSHSNKIIYKHKKQKVMKKVLLIASLVFISNISFSNNGGETKSAKEVPAVSISIQLLDELKPATPTEATIDDETTIAFDKAWLDSIKPITPDNANIE